MSYHILEVRKVDEEGRILSSEFFIVNSAGVRISGPDGGPFGSIEKAIGTLKRLIARDEEPDQPKFGPRPDDGPRMF